MTKLTDRMEELEEVFSMMEDAVRLTQASQSVHEFMIVHLVSHLASMTDNRNEFIVSMIQGVEMSMKLQADAMRKLHGEKVDKALTSTFDYFENFKRKVYGTFEMPSRKGPVN